jgi:membrane protein DedA with SNARE-associated domain
MSDYLSSYLGIVVFLILTGCGLPIPEEVPIVTAGVLASHQSLDPVWAFAACLIGALLGDLVMYSIGYYFGHSLVARHPHLAKLLHAEDEAKVEKMIERHGFKVLLISRFLVGLRSPVYLAAGTIRMPLRKFIAFDTVCAGIVVGTFYWACYFFGEPIAKRLGQMEKAATAFIVIAVLVVLFFTWRKLKRFLSKTLAGENGHASEPSLATTADKEPQQSR